MGNEGSSFFTNQSQSNDTQITPNGNELEKPKEPFSFPVAVEATHIIDKNESAQVLLYHNLKRHGYCPIKVTNTTKSTSSRLSSVAFEYFDQSQEIKNKNLEKDKNNLGYVHIKGVREYLKLRPSDPPELWPTHPDDFTNTFVSFFETYAQIAINSFQLISNYRDPVDNEPLIPPDKVTIISEYLEEKSSVSMIKYFSLEEAKEVCSYHTDTGILTFITRTSRPSLQMYDREYEEYIKVEEYLEEGDIIVFSGEKTPLFACSSKLTATPHRVHMEAGGERMSIAFLLDVAK